MSRIGVFICWCGENIARTVDVEEVAQQAAALPGVRCAVHYKYMCSDPGQALGYMIGALKFKELRERAKAKLGDRFDVRRFHNAVLDDGPLPLAVLDTVVDDWIAREQAKESLSSRP